MLTYKELYEKYLQSEFKDELIRLEIAGEVNCAYGKDDKDFDMICRYVYEMYFDTEALSIHDIVWTIYDHIENEEIYIEDYQEYLQEHYDEIRQEACYYGT